MTQSDFWWSILIRTSKNSSLRKSQEIFVSIDENLSFPSASPIVYTMCQFHNLFRIFFFAISSSSQKLLFRNIYTYIFTFCIILLIIIHIYLVKKMKYKTIDWMTKKGWKCNFDSSSLRVLSFWKICLISDIFKIIFHTY